MLASFGLGVDKVKECASGSILHCNHLKYANLAAFHASKDSTHHGFVLEEVLVIFNHVGMVEHGQHFDLVENALAIGSGHHVHRDLFQDYLQRRLD